MRLEGTARAGAGARRGAAALAVGIAATLAIAGEWASRATAGEAPVKRGAPAKGKAPASAIPQVAAIDEGIAAGWDAAGIKPVKIATDEEFLRRVYLDLVGRIPTLREARAFLTTREPDKRGKLVEYLLEHPDFAKNFATQWTVLLIGRGNQGRQVDRTSLNNWLRKQFGSSRPWNEVVHELVGATGSNKENGAANFVLAHLEFGAVPLTSKTTRLFLGKQIQCTQCHDHPSNQWKQADFWGVNAFFKGVKAQDVMKANDTGGEVYDHTVLNDDPTDAYVSFDKRDGMVGIAFPRFIDGRKIGQGPDVRRRAELAKMISDPQNDSMAQAFVNRTWAHFFGRGFVNPVDDFGPHNEPTDPEVLERLAKDFRESGYDVKKLCRWITTSRAYQLSSVRGKGSEKDDGLFASMPLRPMTPEQLFDSLLTATSAHKAGAADDGNRRRDAWMRQFIFAFANDEAEESSSFQGTIPQALMMMNGELMREATSGKPGSFLAEVCAQAGRGGRSEAHMVESIYLAALSRRPTARELHQAGAFFQNYPDGMQVLEDLFWSLLNSNEFILIH